MPQCQKTVQVPQRLVPYVLLSARHYQRWTMLAGCLTGITVAWSLLESVRITWPWAADNLARQLHQIIDWTIPKQPTD